MVAVRVMESPRNIDGRKCKNPEIVIIGNDFYKKWSLTIFQRTGLEKRGGLKKAHVLYSMKQCYP